MPRPLQTLALLCVLLPLAAASHAKDDGHDKDRATITAEYILNDTAFENKDIDSAVALLTDDFTQVTETGKIVCHSKAEQITIFQRLFSEADKITSHTVVNNLQFTKEGAIATSTNDVALASTRNGETHTIADKSTTQDTWIKVSDRWLIKNSTSTATRQFIDGKPVTDDKPVP